MLWGVTRYEFIMQVRRRWLWIVLAAITIISLRAALVGLHNPEQPISTMPLIQQRRSVGIAEVKLIVEVHPIQHDALGKCVRKLRGKTL